MEVTTYPFSSFTRTLAEKAFQLKYVLEILPFMEYWLERAAKQTITELQHAIIELIYEDLTISASSWNEEELQAEFIYPLLKAIHFTNYQLEIAAFSERSLKKKIKNNVIHGKVDWMVASGKYEPEQPFFFIHEYKKERGSDPVGQLLATMYIAKLLNQEPVKPTLFEPKPISYVDLPIYGCYVVGRHWYFVVLKDKDYYISKSYDATDKEKLYEIVKLLKAQKQMIIERVTKNQ